MKEKTVVQGLTINSGTRVDAILNWNNQPLEEFEGIADEYYRAARILVKEYRKREIHSDLEVYPILYLYRHALELYMKGYLARGYRTVSQSSSDDDVLGKALRSHHLGSLIPGMQRVFEAIGWQWTFQAGGIDTGRDFEDLVHAFDRMDPKSAAFRYPVNAKGEVTFPDSLGVDIQQFSNTMDSLLDTLSGGLFGLARVLDEVCEESSCIEY